MAPTSSILQGLNIVDQPQPSDDHDLPFSHDLATQLKLWSNTHFALDEPFVRNRDRDPLDSSIPYDDSTSPPPSESSTHKSKKIALIPDPGLTNPSSPSSAVDSSPAGTAHPSAFFYNQFLPEFDQFSSTHFSELYPSAGSAGIDGDTHGLASFGGPTLSALNSGNLDAFANASSLMSQQPSASTSLHSDHPSPAKKARTSGAAASKTKSSQTKLVTLPPAPESSLHERDDNGDEEDDDDDDESPSSSNLPNRNGKRDLLTPLTASEDKRRRNTAASARFRLKKKEREQAMERKAKDLESRVNELERECEALRRENGWLKGLVVGVTGGGPSAPGVSDGVGGLVGVGGEVVGLPSLTIMGIQRDREV